MKTESDHAGGHLDELALDALRAGGGTPEHAVHATNCPRCRAALDSLADLEARLKEDQAGIPEVPRAIEARIFQTYRQSLGQPAPLSLPALVRRWSIPVAGLTAAGIAALALRLAPPEPSRVSSRPPASRGERQVVLLGGRGGEKSRMTLDSQSPPATTGRLDAPRLAAAVDIVDAFRLARALRDGQPVAAGWDVDGDGIVGGADVRMLANRAVAL